MRCRDWFWDVWWHVGCGSNYEPRRWWFGRRIYMAGLRDAASIVDDCRDSTNADAIKAIHRRYLSFADKV